MLVNGIPRCSACSSRAGPSPAAALALVSPPILAEEPPPTQQTLLQHHGDNPTVTAPRVLLGQDAVRALRSISKGWCKEGSAGAPCSSTNTCCGLGGGHFAPTSSTGRVNSCSELSIPTKRCQTPWHHRHGAMHPTAAATSSAQLPSRRHTRDSHAVPLEFTYVFQPFI